MLLLSLWLLLRFLKLCLTHNFIEHLESNNLSNHQYGFCKARSTWDFFPHLIYMWSSSPRDFGESSVISFDISKAFDRIWHKVLLARLIALLLPSVNSFLAFYPVALYQLLLTVRLLHSSLSTVVFLRVQSFYLILFSS